MFSRSQVLRWCCYGYLSGVIIGSVPSLLVVSGIILLLLIVFISGRINLSVSFFLLLVCSAAIGYGQIRFSFPHSDAQHIAFYNESEVEWLGVVSEEPDLRLDQQKLTVSSRWRREDNHWQPVSGKVLVTSSLYPRKKYGNLLRMTCRIKTPPADGDFNYQNYLARYDISSICFARAAATVSEGQGNVLKQKILQWKEKLVQRSALLIPEPENALMQGILLGAKKSIPPFLQEDLKKTGLSHIVALSGYNVTIIAALIYTLVQQFGLGKKAGFVLTFIVLLVFIIATGAQSSIIRAALMGLGALLAEALGRRAHAHHLLALSATVMAALNPKIVAFDMGFQLSCAATAGLLFLSSPLEKKLWFIPEWGGFRSSLSSTLAAIIATTPITLFTFRTFSFVAPLANILVLPLIPISMLLGTLMLGASFISWPLAQLIGWLSWLTLHSAVVIIQYLSF